MGCKCSSQVQPPVVKPQVPEPQAVTEPEIPQEISSSWSSTDEPAPARALPHVPKKTTFDPAIWALLKSNQGKRFLLPYNIWWMYAFWAIQETVSEGYVPNPDCRVCGSKETAVTWHLVVPIVVEWHSRFCKACACSEYKRLSRHFNL